LVAVAVAVRRHDQALGHTVRRCQAEVAERVTPAASLRQSAPVFEGGLAAFLPQAFVRSYPAADFCWHHLWFLP
jgi:hypothetical protein